MPTARGRRGLDTSGATRPAKPERRFGSVGLAAVVAVGLIASACSSTSDDLGAAESGPSVATPAFGLSPSERGWGQPQPVEQLEGAAFRSASGSSVVLPGIGSVDAADLEVAEYSGPSDQPFLLSPILSIDAPTVNLELPAPALLEFERPASAADPSPSGTSTNLLASGFLFPPRTRTEY